jgi:hypothetical protein
MKHAFISGALALGLASSLSACDTPDADAVVSATQSFIASVQSEAKTLCGVVPMSLDVASLFDATSPVLATADGLAHVICNAVISSKSASRAKGAHAPVKVTRPDGRKIVVHFTA